MAISTIDHSRLPLALLEPALKGAVALTNTIERGLKIPDEWTICLHFEASEFERTPVCQVGLFLCKSVEIISFRPEATMATQIAAAYPFKIIFCGTDGVIIVGEDISPQRLDFKAHADIAINFVMRNT